MKKSKTKASLDELAVQSELQDHFLDKQLQETEALIHPSVLSVVEMLRLMTPQEKKDLYPELMQKIRDQGLAKIMIIMETAKSDSVKLDAANSLLDRLDLPRQSAQYSKTEASKVNHKDIINIMNQTKPE